MNSRLFVGSLSKAATEDDLRDLFSRVGIVRDVSIIKDKDSGESRGFGFVQMASGHEAATAIDTLHGTELRGRKIRVVEAEPEKPPTPRRKTGSQPKISYVGQHETPLPEDLEEEEEPLILWLSQLSMLPWRRIVPSVVAALALIVGLFFWGGEDITVEVDPRAVVVYPVAAGQHEQDDFLAFAFAQAVAVGLAQSGDIRVLPVPPVAEVRRQNSAQRARSAAKIGAAHLVLAVLTRGKSEVHAALTWVDTKDNRIRWGGQRRGSDNEIPSLATTLAQELGEELGVGFPQTHLYITDLTGSGAMATSTTTTEAVAALRQGQVEIADRSTGALIQKFPRAWQAMALRCHALLLGWDAEPTAHNLGRLNEALKKLERTGKGYPYSDFYRAYIKLQGDQTEQAMQSFSSILERGNLAPAARAWILRYRAMAKLQNNQLDDALEDLAASLRLDPTNPWTFGNLTNALIEAGRFDEALTRARQGLALVPSYWRAHQTLGYVLEAKGKPLDAAHAYERACELGHNQTPCALQAISLQRAGKVDGSSQVAESAAAMVDTPWGQYNLGCFWSLRGDTSKALWYLSKADKLGLHAPNVLTDPDLAALRTESSFQRVAESLKTSKNTR